MDGDNSRYDTTLRLVCPKDVEPLETVTGSYDYTCLPYFCRLVYNFVRFLIIYYNCKTCSCIGIDPYDRPLELLTYVSDLSGTS